MSNHFKPKRVKPDTGPLRVVLFRSRNKDNKNHIEGFQERFESFLTREDIKPGHDLPCDSGVWRKFRSFVDQGRSGELSRMYVSINARDNRKTMKALTEALVDAAFDQTSDQGEIDMASIGQLVVSRAALPENAAEHHWMLDIDNKDEAVVKAISSRLEEIDPDLISYMKRTPNGWHIICDHGFDLRRLGDLSGEVNLKRDGLYLAGVECKD